MMLVDHGVATSPYMLKASRVTMHRLVEKQLVWGIQVFSTPHQHSRNVYKVPIELMRKGRMGFNPKWKQEARRKGETSSGHKKKLKGCFKCEARKALESTCHRNTFRKRIEPIKEKVPKHVLEVIEEELANLDRKEADYGSTNRIYSYLDWLTALPWGKCSDENFDVLRAEKILDEDHYGLRVVKERILEFIAVGNLTGNPEGKIICLSGPPGVGKTSIARSVARALGRKFFRLAVGGVSDSSEIKLGKSRRDPEGAFLELLDPEQNAHFLDHFLDVPIDLSKVLFVCTANNIDRLPASAKAAMVDLDSSETAAEGSIELKNEYLRLADVLKVFEHAVDGGSTRVESREVAEKFTVDESNLSDYVGATPKDGPSAGCTMITSLLSLAMKKPIRKDLAMTGEVTLTGRILPIGGLKEKTMAARRSQVKVIIFPEANRRDFEGLEESVKERLDVHFVDEYEQIFELAFGDDH
uniref:Lon proteolytic domain-containing protein n=1 Tax=Brassica oleracea var. oleracea TaxID=109376 RepID=A0A0D3CPW5_BRAOL